MKYDFVAKFIDGTTEDFLSCDDFKLDYSSGIVKVIRDETNIAIIPIQNCMYFGILRERDE